MTYSQNFLLPVHFGDFIFGHSRSIEIKNILEKCLSAAEFSFTLVALTVYVAAKLVVVTTLPVVDSSPSLMRTAALASTSIADGANREDSGPVGFDAS